MTTTITRRPNSGRTTLPSVFSTDPFGSLRDEFDQMLTNWFSTSDRSSTLSSFAPSMDMNESDTQYEVMVDLPGIKASDVHVQLSDNVLTISGERKSEKKENGKDGAKCHCVERYQGSFSRSIALPAAINQDQIDAQYRDGVLTVTVPKAEAAKPREITIKS